MNSSPSRALICPVCRRVFVGLRETQNYEKHVRRCEWTERFHELVVINGEPEIGEGTRIGIFSEVYDKGGIVRVGAGCDIASFVAINCASSHLRTLGRSSEVGVLPIEIGDHVFIGSHSFIGGGVKIGSGSVVAAGTIIRSKKIIPPDSLVWGNPPRVKKGYYARKT